MRGPLYDIMDIRSRTAAIWRSFATTIRGPVLWLTLCGGLLVTAILLGTMMMVGEFRERALGNSERELENTVLLLTRHFDQQFEELQDHRRRFDRPTANIRDRVAGSVQAANVGGRNPRDPEVQGLDLSRRRIPVRFRRPDRQLVASRADACHQHLRAGLFQDVQVRSAIGTGSGGSGSQPQQRQTANRRRPSIERAGRCFPGRDDAAHRAGQLRAILCVRGTGSGCRHFDVPCRRNADGPLSARRAIDRAELRDGSVVAACPEQGRSAEPARAKPDRRLGAARLRGQAEPVSRRCRRDQHALGRAGRLARANQAHGWRRGAGRTGHRTHSVRDHPPDAPAEPGVASACAGAEAAARHRAQQHDAGARAV